MIQSINVFSVDPSRQVEFVVRDIEDDPLENAEITVKKGDKVLAEKQKTDASGKFKMTSKVQLGDELTVEFFLDPDHAKDKKTFTVGEPEDNTQDKDDPSTNMFTKYLLLKKTNVRITH